MVEPDERMYEELVNFSQVLQDTWHCDAAEMLEIVRRLKEYWTGRKDEADEAAEADESAENKERE